MTGTATSPNIIFKESRHREGVGRRREGVARELGNQDDQRTLAVDEESTRRPAHAGRRRGVDAKSSGTLAVDAEATRRPAQAGRRCEVDEDKPSGTLAVDDESTKESPAARWPSTTSRRE